MKIEYQYNTDGPEKLEILPQWRGDYLTTCDDWRFAASAAYERLTLLATPDPIAHHFELAAFLLKDDKSNDEIRRKLAGVLADEMRDFVSSLGQDLYDLIPLPENNDEMKRQLECVVMFWEQCKAAPKNRKQKQKTSGFIAALEPYFTQMQALMRGETPKEINHNQMLADAKKAYTRAGGDPTSSAWQTVVKQMESMIAWSDTPSTPKYKQAEDGMLWLNARFSRWLAVKYSPERSKEWATKAAEQWLKVNDPTITDYPPAARAYSYWYNPAAGDVSCCPGFGFLGKCVLERMQASIERARRVPSPALPVSLLSTFKYQRKATMIEKTQKGTQFSDEWGWRANLPARLDIDAALAIQDNRLLVPLATYLVQQCHKQWIAGAQRWNEVVLPLGKSALELIMRARCDRQDLDLALRALEDIALRGFKCVREVTPLKKSTGGRDAESLVVAVGAPLAPQGLDQIYKQAGVALPTEFRWYAPIFPAEMAPMLKRSTKDRDTQQAVFCFDLGVTLIQNREQYALEGLPLETYRQTIIDGGLPRHTADELLSEWQLPNRELPYYRGGPVIVPTDEKSLTFVLGGEFSSAHNMIIDASQQASKKAKVKAKKHNRRTRRK